MALEAQDGVPHVVIMRGLHTVKEDDVFQLHGVAHYTARSHQGGAPDEGAVPDLRLRANNAGRAQEGRGSDRGGLVDPNVGGPLLVLRRVQGGAKLQNQLLDAVQSLPGVLELGQVVPRQGVGEVQQGRSG